MKILHTADWHIGDYKGPTEGGVNLRFQDIENCLNNMIRVAAAEKPDVVCVSGDIFNQEQVGPARYSKEMLLAHRTIEALSGAAKLVIVMRGTPNHDGAGQFKVLEEMFRANPRVEVITSPQVLSTPIADFVVVPGFDKQEFRAGNPGLNAEEENAVWTQQISQTVMGLRAACRNSVPSILMAHFTVPGCNLESGQTSCYANFEPVLPREAIESAGFSSCLLGHIHRPQKVTGLPYTYYSGAINALNFNDEGQQRGFWIHTFSGSAHTGIQFFESPFRRFKTLEWTEDDVRAYLAEGSSFLAERYGDSLSGRIIRVRYICTADQRKALNVPVLQGGLYDLGAFFVSDISAEQTVDINARGLLAEENDPLENLRKWLREKCYEDPDAIADLGQPIIDGALARSTTADVHGVFRPVSIRVKNYRNYIEELFEFSNVSFCSVNGVNGAGKSSLFFDAIMDCLYEDTREGDQKAWIRGTPDARSGLIEFIWDIGDQRFRVVRTRLKSGKPTLNLSQMGEDGEWVNLSKEKIVDTQAEIIRILGMDPMTFKSCALIMQDQYGIFLQAKKDERIAVLSVLLGLGIYGAMEQDAKNRAKEVRSRIMSLKDEQQIKTALISAKGSPEEDLAIIDKAQVSEEDQLAKDEKNREMLIRALEKKRQLEDQLDKASQDLADGKRKRKELHQQQAALEESIADLQKSLANSDNYRELAQAYRDVEKEVHSLEKDKVRYDAAAAYLDGARNRCSEARKKAVDVEERIAQLDRRLGSFASINHDIEECDQNIQLLAAARIDLDDMRSRIRRDQEAVNRIQKVQNDRATKRGPLEFAIKVAESDLADQEQQAEYLGNSGCVDLANARCRFLKHAKEIVSKRPDTEERIRACKEELDTIDTEFRGRIEGLMAEREMIKAPSPEEEREARQLVEGLLPYETRRKQLENAKLEIARLRAEKDSLDKIHAEYAKNLSSAESDLKSGTLALQDMSENVKKYQEALERLETLKIYPALEAMIPLKEEKLRSALDKLSYVEELAMSTTETIEALSGNVDDLQKALGAIGKTDLHGAISNLDELIANSRRRIGELQMSRGSAKQRLEDIRQLRQELKEISVRVNGEAVTLSRYEILKTAFSQDGVPHQIIRNIIPHIKETANSILGSMTGGTMGVDFVLDKVTKGRDGEKATLDVVIEEYGKTTLPYSSKSGGEKVKASLAVILALAEIKTSAAGIQLGMLFIDEPPFLDADGTDAYVDALETIRQRYPDVKIMAITHDEAMKARFSQSVEIIKTEDGSKVIY